MDLREQKFGIEVELTGITRQEAAAVLGKYFSTVPKFAGGSYNEYHVKDQENRTWKLVYDSSISPQIKSGNSTIEGDTDHKVEMVSPICTYNDVETVQNLVRSLRAEGGFANQSCGIHIHINGAPFEATQIRNLVNIIAAKEDMIYRALQVTRNRENNYCKKTDPIFLNKLNEVKPKTREKLKEIWYNGDDGSHRHYHESRYRCLNLHSLFQKNTIEFRAFNAELHPEKIKAYIQFCMAITAQAYNQKSASPQKTVSTNEKYTFRVWTLRLGMIGDEFKSARKHLLSHLEGNIAWKDPAQAVAQKERLRAKHQKEQEVTQQERPPENHQETQLNQPENENYETQEQESASGFSMSME